MRVPIRPSWAETGPNLAIGKIWLKTGPTQAEMDPNWGGGILPSSDEIGRNCADFGQARPTSDQV